MKLTKPSCITVVPVGEVRAEPHPVGVGDAHAGRDARSRPSAGTCPRRSTVHRAACAQPQPGPLEVRRRAHGPALVQTTLASSAEDAVEVDARAAGPAGARAGAAAGRRRRVGRRRVEVDLARRPPRLRDAASARASAPASGRPAPSGDSAASSAERRLRDTRCRATSPSASYGRQARTPQTVPVAARRRRSPCRPCGGHAVTVAVRRCVRRAALDLAPGRPHADRGPGRHRVRQRRRGARSPTPSRTALRALPAPGASTATATRCSRAPTSAAPERVVLAGHLDTVPDRRQPARRGATATGCTAAARRDMKAGVAVAAAAGRAWPSADPRRHRTSSTTARRSRRRATGSAGWPAAAPGLAGRPTSRCCSSRPTAWSRRGCQGTLRVEVTVDRAARAQRPVLAGRQRDPRRGAGARPAGGVRAAAGRSSTGWTTARGSTRSASPAASPATSSPTSAWSRSTTGSRRTARWTRRWRTCARCSTAYEVTADRRRAGARCPGSTAPAAAAFVAAIGGRAAGRSSAGPTWRGSPRSASRRSTTAPATRASRTRREEYVRDARSSSARSGLRAG